MTVQLWSGQEFETTHEREALYRFVADMNAKFGQSDELYLILANYYIGGHQVDLTVLKRDAVIVIELKECVDPFRATENGDWLTIPDGEVVGTARQNPFQQAKGYRFRWVDFLRDEFLSSAKAHSMNFYHVSAFVAISPSLHQDTENNLPRTPWFRLVGIDELSLAVSQQTSQMLNFSNKELSRLVAANVLNLTQFDVDDFLSGWLKEHTEPLAQSSPLPVRTPTSVRMVGHFYEDGPTEGEIWTRTMEIAVASGIKEPNLESYSSHGRLTSLLTRGETTGTYQPVIKTLLGRDYCVYMLILSARDDDYCAPVTEVAQELEDIDLGTILPKSPELDLQIYTCREVPGVPSDEAPPALFADEGRPSTMSRFQGLSISLVCAYWSHLNRYVLIPALPVEASPQTSTDQNRVISQTLDDLARLEVYHHKLRLNYGYYRQHYEDIEAIETRVNRQISEAQRELMHASVTQLRQTLKRFSEQLVNVLQLASAVQHNNYTAEANRINLERQFQGLDEVPIAGYTSLSHLFLPEANQIAATLSQFSERIANMHTALDDLIQAIRLRVELSQ